MFELIIIIIGLFIIFIFAGWYAKYRSKQRAKLFQLDVESYEVIPEQPEHEFGNLFQQQMADSEQSETITTLDTEPAVTLSQTGREHSRQTSGQKPEQGVLDLETAQQAPKINTDAPDLTTEQIQSAKFNIDSEDEDQGMVVALTVIAKPDQTFKGTDIKRVLQDLKLHFGDMNIYHSTSPFDQHRLFSVANMMQPGTLQDSELANNTLKGLILFLTLPQAVNGLLAFEEMLDTARKIADKLNGDLCDQQRQLVTESEIETLRSRILNFNLDLQSEQSQFKHDYSI